MKTPDFYIPFDPNKIDRSPIMTPELTAAESKIPASEGKRYEVKKENANNMLCNSFYHDQEEKKGSNPELVMHQGSSPSLKIIDNEKPKNDKKYFSSTNLLFRKGSSKEGYLDHLFDPKFNKNSIKENPNLDQLNIKKI